MPSIAEIAAQIHANMCNHPGFGYDWSERYGGPEYVTWNIFGQDYTVKVGDYECGTSVKTAWATALQGTPYEGCLEGYVYSGNCRRVFEESGLFYSSYDNAKRGDVYLNDENHVAMCQDGGDDGVYGYDCLSEFSMNEFGGVYGGERGDQTGWESHICGFYEYPGGWGPTLHYNGKADGTREVDKMPEPKQIPGEAVNDYGFRYQEHVQNLGWCEWVRDGQTAGTVSFGLRMEALRIDPPAGFRCRVRAHIQNVGWRTFDGIVHGNEVIIGTTGECLRIEMLIIEVLERPDWAKNLKLMFRVHQENVGWKGWTEEGYASGSDAEAMRLEAIQIKLVKA